MSVYYSRFRLNTYANTPYFLAQLPPGYPINLVLQKARAFRRLPPNLRELAELAKRRAVLDNPEYAAGQRDIADYYDPQGFEKDPDTGRRLTNAEIDAQWPPDPSLDNVVVTDIPEPPGGFPNPLTWEEPIELQPRAGHEEPDATQLVKDIKARGYEATAAAYGIPVEDLPPGVAMDALAPARTPQIGDVDENGDVLVAVATGELYDGPYNFLKYPGTGLPPATNGAPYADGDGATENAFCPTGPGGGIDPTCSPGDLAHTARAAHGRNDQDVLAKVKDLVAAAGKGRAKKGELGVKGLTELAKALGVKKTSGLKKAGLSQAVQDHLHKMAGSAPASELADRLDRLGLAEKYTGVKFSDRVLNGVIASHSTGQSAAYREAYADVARRGASAKAEYVTLLRKTREQFKQEIENGGHDKLLDHVLAGVAANGHGNLSRREFLDHLRGKVPAAASVTSPQGGKNGAAGGGDIVPDDLTLKPARKSRKKRSVTAPEPDYIDRLREPVTDRLKHVKDVEKQTNVPFASRVLHTLASDHRVTLPGKANYHLNSAREAAGERLTADERRGLSGFRQALAAAVKFGDVPPEHVVDALEKVDAGRHGTVRVDEFMTLLKKGKVW